MEYGLPRRVAEENVYSHMARIRGVGRNCSTIQRMDRTLLGTPLPSPSPSPPPPPSAHRRSSGTAARCGAAQRGGKKDGKAPAGQKGRERRGEKDNVDKLN